MCRGSDRYGNENLASLSVESVILFRELVLSKKYYKLLKIVLRGGTCMIKCDHAWKVRIVEQMHFLYFFILCFGNIRALHDKVSL